MAKIKRKPFVPFRPRPRFMRKLWMMGAPSPALPFYEARHTMAGQKYLTRFQVVSDRRLGVFVREHPAHFGPGPINVDIVLYYPNGDAPQ